MATEIPSTQNKKRPSDAAKPSGVDDIAKDIHVEDAKLGNRERIPKPEGVKSGRILWEYVIPVIGFHHLSALSAMTIHSTSGLSDNTSRWSPLQVAFVIKRARRLDWAKKYVN